MFETCTAPLSLTQYFVINTSPASSFVAAPIRSFQYVNPRHTFVLQAPSEESKQLFKEAVQSSVRTLFNEQPHLVGTYLTLLSLNVIPTYQKCENMSA